jgi:hypothetical protein
MPTVTIAMLMKSKKLLLPAADAAAISQGSPAIFLPLYTPK